MKKFAQREVVSALSGSYSFLCALARAIMVGVTYVRVNVSTALLSFTQIDLASILLRYLLNGIVRTQLEIFRRGSFE